MLQILNSWYYTTIPYQDQTLVKGGQSLLVAKKRARGFGKYVQKFRSKITHRDQDDAKTPVETSDGFPGAGPEAIMSSANDSDANRATVNAGPVCDGTNSGNTDSCCTSSNKCTFNLLCESGCLVGPNSHLRLTLSLLYIRWRWTRWLWWRLGLPNWLEMWGWQLFARFLLGAAGGPWLLLRPLPSGEEGHYVQVLY